MADRAAPAAPRCFTPAPCAPSRSATRSSASRTIPTPSPGAGEILVRVKAAGINGADMMQRRGLYPAPPGSPPDIPGLELAGEVVACGPGAERFARAIA